MKKLLVVAGVTGLLFAGTGSAIARSDNPNACFGQTRSLVAQDGGQGQYSSERKGENAEINQAWMLGQYEGSPCTSHSGNPGGKP